MYLAMTYINGILKKSKTQKLGRTDAACKNQNSNCAQRRSTGLI